MDLVTARAECSDAGQRHRPHILPPEKSMPSDRESSHLEVHVAVCAERYKALEYRLDRIERVLWWMLSTLILSLGGMVFELVILMGKRFV